MLHTTIGANLGEALEQAKQKAGHDITVKPYVAPAHRPAQQAKAQLIGIDFRPAPGSSAMTMDARELHTGRIYVGPECNSVGQMDYPEFLTTLQTHELTFNGFRTVDPKTGRFKLIRGSFVTNRFGSYVCPACGAVDDTKPAKMHVIRKQKGDGNKQPMCSECAQARVAWRHTVIDPLDPEDNTAKRLYSAFESFDPETTVTDERMVPRVWAIYSATGAPTDWAPDSDDSKAQEIALRLRKSGYVMRPWEHAWKSKSPALVSLIVEATTDQTGTPGLSVGWLSRDALNDGLTAQYGYTVRLLLRRNSPQQIRRVVV